VRIWLITVGEPLPLEKSLARRWRTSLLADVLLRRGHHVLWWTSTVDHFTKQHIATDDCRRRLANGLEMQFLHAVLYRRNVSVARLINHVQIGWRFRQLATAEPRPDVIVASLPTIELAHAAVEYGRQHQVPVVIDVRDLWPDIFVDIAPPWIRFAARVLLYPLFRKTAAALRGCAGIVAVSAGYLSWGLSRAGRDFGRHDAVFPLGYERRIPTNADRETVLHLLQRNGITTGRPIAVFAGSFGRSYDLETVIVAARLLGQQGASVQFVLCGAGERDRSWRELASGVPGVLFTGWLSSSQLNALLELATLGLAAYAVGAPQGISNKVIEYMAAGLAVVTSLTGEARELIETVDCGSYYPAGDARALAHVLAAYAGAPDRCIEQGRRARSYFDMVFDARTVFGQMADHLEGFANVPADESGPHPDPKTCDNPHRGTTPGDSTGLK
jgi:glycosyltransferase involved in cell wall biosynthesis